MNPIIETNNCEEDDIVFANNIATLVVLPYAIRSTVELGIFNVLAKAKKGTKLSAKDIAVEIKESKCTQNVGPSSKVVGLSLHIVLVTF